MIKAILVFNNHGKPRAIKFFQHYPEDLQQQIIKETFQLISKREDNVCNFLEGGTLAGDSDFKIVYRHYATLYFVFCVDSSESELGILDLIQVFVETLDKCFENVCELDLIFHVDTVHYLMNEMILGGLVAETNNYEALEHLKMQTKLSLTEVHCVLSEMVMGGMVLETSLTEIITRIEDQTKLQRDEAGFSSAPSKAFTAVKEMNLPQKIKDIKIGDLPTLGNIKF